MVLLPGACRCCLGLGGTWHVGWVFVKGMTFPSQFFLGDCFIHHDPGSLSNNQDSMESNRVFFRCSC